VLWLQLLRLLRLLLRWKSCDIALWNGCQIVLISIRLWLWGVTAKTSTRGSRLKRLWSLWLSKGVICAKLIETGLLRLLKTRLLWLLKARLLRLLEASLLRLLEASLLRLLEGRLLRVKAGLLRLESGLLELHRLLVLLLLLLLEVLLLSQLALLRRRLLNRVEKVNQVCLFLLGPGRCLRTVGRSFGAWRGSTALSVTRFCAASTLPCQIFSSSEIEIGIVEVVFE
jgi:hypothetical protein